MTGELWVEHLGVRAYGEVLELQREIARARITGEISEPQAHYAREMGVAFLAAGHHATERYGAPALAGEVARQLGVQHQFIDIDNPA